jgi:hypothetical protein
MGIIGIKIKIIRIKAHLILTEMEFLFIDICCLDPVLGDAPGFEITEELIEVMTIKAIEIAFLLVSPISYTDNQF